MILIIDLFCPLPSATDVDEMREKIAKLMFDDGVLSLNAHRALGATGSRARSGKLRRRWLQNRTNSSALLKTEARIEINVQTGPFAAKVRQIERPGGMDFWKISGGRHRSLCAQRILGIMYEATKVARNGVEFRETDVDFVDEWAQSIMDINEKRGTRASHHQHRAAVGAR